MDKASWTLLEAGFQEAFDREGLPFPELTGRIRARMKNLCERVSNADCKTKFNIELPSLTPEETEHLHQALQAGLDEYRQRWTRLFFTIIGFEVGYTEAQLFKVRHPALMRLNKKGAT